MVDLIKKTEKIFILIGIFMCVFVFSVNNISAETYQVYNEADLIKNIDSAPTNGDETIIEIKSDFEMVQTKVIKPGMNIKIIDDGNARVLSVKNAVTQFEVNENATLTISTSSNSNDLLVFNEMGIKNVLPTFTSKGRLNWDGGTLQNGGCCSGAFLGQIHIAGENASFYLSDGLFQDNSRGYFGGVVRVDSSAYFQMDGGIFKNNNITSVEGATIYISARGTTADKPTRFVMNDGIIQANKGYTGGVFIGNTTTEHKDSIGIAKAVINGGTIDGNSSTEYGGGVSVLAKGDLTMNGGTISNNTSDTMGGGVLAWDSWKGYWEKRYLDAGYSQEWIDNTWKNTWSKTVPASFTLNGGEIINNTAKDTKHASGTGGGIYAGSDNVTLKAGVISGNKAEKQGGGVYVPTVPYHLNMYNAVISENTASIIGGGLWLCPTGDVKVYISNGGAFFNNEAVGAGNDIASIAKKESNYILTLANRLLGGGSIEWWNDGGILEFGNLGNADTEAPRFPNTTIFEESIVDNQDDNVLHAKSTSDGQELAKKFAKLYITKNEAPRGGGIGTNGSVSIGEKGNLKDITVKKEWLDLDNKYDLRSESIEVKLKYDGLEVDSVVLNDKNDWQHTFKDLPIHEKEYTLDEVTVPKGYTSKVTNEGDEYTITNKLKNTEVIVTKVWKDNDDEEKLRPEFIKVKLMNGSYEFGEAVLSDDNDWTYTFSDLPLLTTEYSVEEVEVPAGYTSKVAKEGNDFTITNTIIDKEVEEPKDNKESNLPKLGSELGNVVLMLLVSLTTIGGVYQFKLRK